MFEISETKGEYPNGEQWTIISYSNKTHAIVTRTFADGMNVYKVCDALGEPRVYMHLVKGEKPLYVHIVESYPNSLEEIQAFKATLETAEYIWKEVERE